MALGRNLQAITVTGFSDIQNESLERWHDNSHFLVPNDDDALAVDVLRSDFYIVDSEQKTSNLRGIFFKKQGHDFNPSHPQDLQKLQQIIFTQLGWTSSAEKSGNQGGVLCMPQTIYYPIDQILSSSMSDSETRLGMGTISAPKILISSNEAGIPCITVKAHINAVKLGLLTENTKKYIPVDIDFSYQLVFNSEKKRYELDINSFKKGGADADIIEEALLSGKLSDATTQQLLARAIPDPDDEDNNHPYHDFINQVIKLERDIKGRSLQFTQDSEFRNQSLEIIEAMNKLTYSSLKEYMMESSAQQQARVLKSFKKDFASKLSELNILKSDYAIKGLDSAITRKDIKKVKEILKNNPGLDVTACAKRVNGLIEAEEVKGVIQATEEILFERSYDKIAGKENSKYVEILKILSEHAAKRESALASLVVQQSVATSAPVEAAPAPATPETAQPSTASKIKGYASTLSLVLGLAALATVGVATAVVAAHVAVPVIAIAAAAVLTYKTIVAGAGLICMGLGFAGLFRPKAFTEEEKNPTPQAVTSFRDGLNPVGDLREVVSSRS